MTRSGTAFWWLLVCATALATFAVKYQVRSLDRQLARVEQAAAAQDHELRVLDAEWAYLNRPAELAEMNRRFLGLLPITTRQLETKIADIPMPAPLPAPPAAQGVALAAVSASGLSALPVSLEKPALPVGGAGKSPEGKPGDVRSPEAKSLQDKAVSDKAAPDRPLDGRSLDLLIARIAAGR